MKLRVPPQFSGLSREQPIEIYRRNLPHWRQAGGTYFVTFQLNDAMPKLVRDRLLKVSKRSVSTSTEERQLEWLRLYYEALDLGYGECFLMRPALRKVVVDALRFFEDPGDSSLCEKRKREIRYWLGSAVVMPNHVHAIIRPLDSERFPLEKILQSIKVFSARKINQLRGSEGQVWAEESHDRIIRDPKHLNRCIQYIGRNPAKAGLGPEQTERWVHPAWEAGGWGFRGNR